ncbi:hypothetical protein IMG5_152500, partial [Ichthyophthirius multifiliis]
YFYQILLNQRIFFQENLNMIHFFVFIIIALLINFIILFISFFVIDAYSKYFEYFSFIFLYLSILRFFIIFNNIYLIYFHNSEWVISIFSFIFYVYLIKYFYL